MYPAEGKLSKLYIMHFKGAKDNIHLNATLDDISHVFQIWKIFEKIKLLSPLLLTI